MVSFFSHRIHRWLTLAICAVLTTTTATYAQAEEKKPTPPNIDPQAQVVLNQMNEAYKVLNSLSVTIQIQSTGEKADNSTLAIAYKRPNQVAATLTNSKGESKAVSDGTNYFFYSPSKKDEFVKGPAPTDKGALMQITSNLAPDGALSPYIVTGSGVLNNILNMAESVALGEAQDLNGTSVDVVKAKLKRPAGVLVFYIGKDDHFLRKLDVEVNFGGGAISLVETHSNIKSNAALTETAFAFTPPAGAKEVAPEKEPAYYDESLKAGGEIKLVAAKDLVGKDLVLDQYKGKVVLLDFWATWCGPCRAEIPNLVETYQKLHPKGFEIVSVSLDEAKSKPELLKVIKESKMDWRHVFDGKAWKSDLATQFKVRAIPFTLLIGKDGKIAAVNVRGEELEPEVTKALGL